MTDLLPAELLIDIFAYLPFWDRVRAATVCRRWRIVSLDAAVQLWSTIVVPGNAEACGALLNRARGAPIAFRIPDMNEDNYTALCALLVKHLPHLKAFDLTLPSPASGARGPPDRMSEAVSGALTVAAPILERIRIANRWNLFLDPDDLLRGPNLNAIELHGVDLGCLRGCRGSAMLRSLVATEPQYSWEFVSVDWPLMRSFPSLRTLAVKVTNYDTRAAPSHPSPFPVNLRHLALALPPDLLRQLANPGDIAALDSWHIAFISPTLDFVDLAAVMSYLQTITPTLAAIQFDGLIINLRLVDTAGRHGTMQAVRLDPTWGALLAGVAELSIGGLGSLPRIVLETTTALPSLKDLTLDVTPLPGVFASNWFKWPRLSCPHLRTVRLRSVTTTSNIPLNSFSTFVRDALGTGLSKLTTLALDRVHPTAQPGVDVMSVLNGLSETVSVLDTGSIWPGCHLAWNKSWDELCADLTISDFLKLQI
ncbi:hypothetical protein AURDEDRAFT_172421 [Auricularia subglabra TFB-10046 SS5]|nr:hypothetical protein AURDEDRAFT_172421 [Auricularia subglabra TFB-10046 SS5]